MRQTSARPGAAVMFGAARGRGWLRRGRRIGRAAVLAVMAGGWLPGARWLARRPTAHSAWRSPPDAALAAKVTTPATAWHGSPLT